MLGQAHTPRRRLWPLVAFALAVLVAPAVGGANPSHSVSSLRARDAAIAARSRSAVLGLYSLDQRLAAADTQLAALRRQAVSLRAARASLRLQLRIAHRSTAAAQRQLARRIRVLYEQGNVETIEILFGSKSLDDAMTNLDNLSRVSSQGEDALVQLKAARARLTAAARDLLTRESALAAATREAQATAASLAEARAQRAAYISSLAAQRRLTRTEIATIVARARAAQVRTATIARVVPTAATSAPPPEVVASNPVPAGRAITVSATGYALGGRTSTGLTVGWGVAAVDPSVIPLDTHMTGPGYGEGVAADTGGAVSGATIDLWFPTIAQASAWGRRTVTIILH
ncbi:MAG: 3D domain-containing protein [Gaiellaceae bacterium]